MRITQGDIDPKNPESIKHIIVALSELLARFSEPDHRWLAGKNTVLNTGVFVKQSRKDLNCYSLIFYTPDDICVRCIIDMEKLIANFEMEITGLMAGVCDYLVQRRGHDTGAMNIVDQQVIDKAVDAEMKRSARQSKPEIIH